MTRESHHNNLNSNGDEISLKEVIIKINEWWRYLLSKWIIISFFGILGGVLGFYYAVTRNVLYTATTTFVLEDEKVGNGLGSLAGLASMAGVDLGANGGGIFQGDNILQLYKSRTILEHTLLTPVEFNGKKQLLIDRYIVLNKLNEKWRDNPELINLSFKDDKFNGYDKILKPNRIRDSILGIIVTDLNKNYLTVTKPDKKLSTIQVDVQSNDEFFAKNFNNALVKNVNEFYINTKTKKSLQNAQILQHKTDSVRAVMNGAIYSAAVISDATPNLNLTKQAQRVAPTQKAQFSAETNKAILSSLVQNLEMTKMSLLKETPLIQVLDEPVYPLKKEKLNKIRGLVFGIIIAIFFITVYLFLKKLLKEILR